MRSFLSRLNFVIQRPLLFALGLWFALLCAVPPVVAESPLVRLSATPIAVADLPAEARSTLDLIRRGGPFPYDKDGTVFGNREQLLPRAPRGHYTEYTVRTPGVRHRGARRIVAGGDPRSAQAEFWYTDDHYQSFRRIRE